MQRGENDKSAVWTNKTLRFLAFERHAELAASELPWELSRSEATGLEHLVYHVQDAMLEK